MIELLIQNGSNLYEPIIEGSIQWITERKGQPGKLTFTVLPDAALNFQEGNAVRFKSDDQKVFYGFVFTKQRSKDKKIKVTVYDQLRYMKNKASYQYTNKTATEVTQALASQFGLKVGILEDTGWKIPSRIEANTTLMDMQLTALDLTTQNTGKLFVLYDDFGEIMLKDMQSMKLDVLIDDESSQDFSYSSSIDGETYNRIKLYNKNTGEVVIAEDQKNKGTWGMLQFFDYFDTNDDVNINAKAKSLLDLYNRKTRSLTIQKAFGDPRVRAGSLIPIQLALGDVNILNYLIVEKVTHTFSKDEHFMDLSLKGGVINA
jgi:hypothetical protein